MLVCNAAGEKYPKVADNFFITVNKTVRMLQTIFQNKNCLQTIFCVRDYVAVSRCFCHGDLGNTSESFKKRNAWSINLITLLCLRKFWNC